jgi:hypothetical protein
VRSVGLPYKSVAKVIQGFVNPTQNGENLQDVRFQTAPSSVADLMRADSSLDREAAEQLYDFASVAEMSSVISDVITGGKVVKENADKTIIEKDGYRVVVRKNMRNNKGEVIQSKDWMVTSYEVSVSAKERARRSSANTLITPISTYDGRAVATDEHSASADKGTDVSDNAKENN